MKPTKPMREALDKARRQPLQRRHDNTPGAPPWPAHPCTLHALVRHDLLAYNERRSRTGHRMQEWTITPAGRLILNPPPKIVPDRPVYMAVTSGTTANPHESLDYDIHPATGVRMAVEKVDVARLNPKWANAAEDRHAKAQDARRHASQLARRLRAA